MRCTRPLKASQDADGNIVYSIKKAIPGLVPFHFECRKCLPCRLNIAREKAVRAVHEARMHEDSIFLTLTYSDDQLTSDKLYYVDFQKFMKRLRARVPQKINYIVTGEYGEKNKRPHWHALIFNYRPSDSVYQYTTDRGDKVYNSKFIDDLWGKNDPTKAPSQFGEVTIDSAGYVARYAAKKLVHGKDHEHDYHPIHKVSSKRAIGRSWIEKHWKHTFENGFVVLPNGQKSRIPRYYVDWLKKEKPAEYVKYATTVRENIIRLSEEKTRHEELQDLTAMLNYKGGARAPKKRKTIKETILKSKFKRLQERLKL